MSIISYVTATAGEAGAAALVKIASVYGFSFALFDRVEDGSQGLPIDIALAISKALSLPLGDVLQQAKKVAPPGPQSRRAVPPRLITLVGSSGGISSQLGQSPLISADDLINSVQIKEPGLLPAVRIAPVTQPISTPIITERPLLL